MTEVGKRRNIPKEYIILGILITLIVIIGLNDVIRNKTAVNNPASTTTDTSQNKTIEKEERNISVSVSRLPDKSSDDSMSFNIALNTHSVNMDSFDFQKSVRLEKDKITYSPLTVTTEGEGHHRRATITFKSVQSPFTVVLFNLGDIPRREFSY